MGPAERYLKDVSTLHLDFQLIAGAQEDRKDPNIELKPESSNSKSCVYVKLAGGAKRSGRITQHSPPRSREQIGNF